jgi:hypothetical protein
MSSLPFIFKGENTNNLCIDELEVSLGRKLPDYYKKLLLEINGFILENGITIYSSKDLYERNQTFEVDEYAPGYLLIGDDSGGLAILINMENYALYIVDQGIMDPDEMEKISNSLEEWIDGVCPMVKLN